MADLIPDSKNGQKPKATELRGTRDQLQERILTDTWWCMYCCCGGCGIDGFDLPCCFCLGEICCCGGTIKAAPCWDQDGCCAVSSKCCCSLIGFECPIDNTPGIGCCSCRTMSNIEDKEVDQCTSLAAKNELDTYKKTFWCWSCYCCFQGLSYDMSPICSQEGKCCCLWLALESASCCDDGWIEYDSKCCGVVCDCSIPAGLTKGVACCNVALCCENMPNKPEE